VLGVQGTAHADRRALAVHLRAQIALALDEMGGLQAGPGVAPASALPSAAAGLPGERAA
jgi:hypothetical protein